MTKLILSIGAVTLFSNMALAAKVKCTTEDKSKWMDQQKFQDDRKAEGFKIKVFKIANDSCYEIYGWNKEGKKVEIYYNPVNGEVVKEYIKK